MSQVLLSNSFDEKNLTALFKNANLVISVTSSAYKELLYPTLIDDGRDDDGGGRKQSR